MYITLRCSECPSMDCEGCPLGTYVPEGSLRGCTRLAGEEDEARHAHLSDEVLPFLSQLRYDDKVSVLQEMEDVELRLCASPLGRYLDAKGKAK